MAMHIRLLAILLTVAAGQDGTGCRPQQLDNCTNQQKSLIKELLQLAPQQLSKRLHTERQKIQRLQTKMQQELRAFQMGEKPAKSSEPVSPALTQRELLRERSLFDQDFQRKMQQINEEMHAAVKGRHKDTIKGPFGVPMKKATQQQNVEAVQEKRKRLLKERHEFMSSFSSRMAKLQSSKQHAALKQPAAPPRGSGADLAAISEKHQRSMKHQRENIEIAEACLRVRYQEKSAIIAKLKDVTIGLDKDDDDDFDPDLAIPGDDIRAEL